MSKYHVFYAADYKGGELHSYINQTLEQAIESVYDYWLDDVDQNDLLELTDGEHRELTDDEISLLLDRFYVGTYDTYAGYGRSYPNIYVSTEDGLKLYDFSEEDLISWAKKCLAADKDYKEFVADKSDKSEKEVL